MYIQHYRGMVLLTVCNAGTVVGGGLVEALPKSTVGGFFSLLTVAINIPCNTLCNVQITAQEVNIRRGRPRFLGYQKIRFLGWIGIHEAQSLWYAAWSISGPSRGSTNTNREGIEENAVLFTRLFHCYK